MWYSLFWNHNQCTRKERGGKEWCERPTLPRDPLGSDWPVSPCSVTCDRTPHVLWIQNGPRFYSPALREKAYYSMHGNLSSLSLAHSVARSLSLSLSIFPSPSVSLSLCLSLFSLFLSLSLLLTIQLSLHHHFMVLLLYLCRIIFPNWMPAACTCAFLFSLSLSLPLPLSLTSSIPLLRSVSVFSCIPYKLLACFCIYSRSSVWSGQGAIVNKLCMHQWLMG